MQISPKVEIITKNAVETKKLGMLLAQEINDGSPTSIISKQATVISLEGDLGTGKTTFTQGFAKALGIRDKIQSPTYVILKIYPVRSQIGHQKQLFFRANKKTSSGVYSKYTNFIHIDAYRVGPKDFAILGWKDFIKNQKNIILVEWGAKIKKILPKSTLHILFTHQKKCNERKIKIMQ